MTKSIFLTLALTAAIPLAAQAQSKPMLIPQHDAIVTYHLNADRDAPSSVQVFYQAGGGRLRIESDNQPGYILIDRQLGKAEMVMPGSNFGLETDIGRQIDRALNDPDARFEFVGPGMVAGLPCTIWRLNSPDAKGQGCVSRDGLILSAEGHDRKGKHAALKAVSVNEAPLPVAEFAAPAQTLRLDSLAKFGKALRGQ